MAPFKNLSGPQPVDRPPKQRKRRLDDREASAESGTEQEGRPAPNLRPNAPFSKAAASIDPSGFNKGAISLPRINPNDKNPSLEIVKASSHSNSSPTLPSNTDSRPLRQPIHNAVQCGSLQGTKFLIDADPRCVHVVDKDGKTPALVAALGGFVDILKLLIMHKADLNLPDHKKYRSPIHEAALAGHTEVVQMLLANGAHLDPLNSHGTAPLALAAQNGHCRIVEMLLEKGASPNIGNRDGVTALLIAAQNGYCKIVEMLLEKDADPNTVARDGSTALLIAAQNGHYKIVKTLLGRNANPDPAGRDGVTALGLAVQNGHHEIAKMLLNTAVLIEAKFQMGDRPIHKAALGGHPKIVGLLLSRGATPDPADNNGITPLWIASRQGHGEVVRLLLKAGASVDVTVMSQYGCNQQPIHVAARGGHLDVVRALIAFGATSTPEADGFDDWETTPFLLACESGNPDLIDLFLDQGVDVNTRGPGDLWGALHYAAGHGYVEIGRLLILRKCDINGRTSDGLTPLMIAAEQDFDFVELLLRYQANVHLEEKNGITALWCAAGYGQDRVIRCLLVLGAKQLPAKSTKQRPIHQAAMYGHLACVKLLLENSPDQLDVADNDGFTALTLAASKNEPEHLRVMKYLVDQGAKVIT